ncbi:MAG: hypothetical protein LKH74_05655 [Levilactobacillus sp.]|jgi:prepilin signal peptidase PulO-like enzyme (type II secretory pathway)|uniref:Uncharacterized protein n=1 Tax=Levilactobacillus suantsaiihabitans TaxID=2487722 RepID=A0A4Z0JBR8_9LACO|nr:MULTISPECIES: hypothetical protein [Levilactobacillus]MCI1553394.1 hypothetical protein [Levilactobacillus sp.]MCI1599071.1 hypothetical protein [Levilactobacillus sp.]MCI1606593.1 hypothetical protein [Levilactobacillus sp.]TGD19767.1 hypothetical protein EGT51_02725 [Levilactobacillus suantsaiihabitans]
MKFDWRYAFHSFWFLMALMVLLSLTTAVDHVHGVRIALGVIFGFLLVDGLWTWQYPYFNRLGRQGASAMINLVLFVIIAAFTLAFKQEWSASVWGFMSFWLASIGGTIDGYLARPTKILASQTRGDLRKKAEILQNSSRL